MTRLANVLAGMVLALFALTATGRADDEEMVPLNKLPKPVIDAVKKRFPKAELVSAAKETDMGKTEYEVTIKVARATIDVTVAPDGAILGIEKTIAAKDLPKAVTAALAAKYPKAVFKTVEQVIKFADGKEQPAYFEVLLETAGKVTVEVEVAADGTIMSAEEKTK